MQEFEDKKAQKNILENQSEVVDNFKGVPEKLENQKHNIYSNNSKKDFAPKLVFGVLLVLALLTLIYGFTSLTKNIYGPQSERAEELNNLQAEQSDVINNLLEQQSVDTDGDGLTDYDEQNIYGTSPFMPDTDSDGYTDKQELDAGYDPLCPNGQDCRGVTDNSQTNPDDSDIDFENPDDQNIVDVLPQEVVDELNKLTPAEIRQLLLESGQMTQEQLDLVDDEILMGIFQEVLNQ